MAKTERGFVRKAARRSAAEWAAEVAAWKRSGSTAREYAGARGISAASLLWWSSRGGQRATHAAEMPASPSRGARGGRARAEGRGFVPVRIVAPVADEPRVEAEIVLAGGRRVRVAGALTLEQLARLLEAVEGGGAC